MLYKMEKGIVGYRILRYVDRHVSAGAVVSVKFFTCYKVFLINYTVANLTSQYPIAQRTLLDVKDDQLRANSLDFRSHR